MTLSLYETAARKKVPFQSVKPGEVKIYVCGVTVYDHCHIGHGRAYVTFDLMVRYFKFLGYKVTYVRNITDIDDKIIEKAKQVKDENALLDKTKQLTHDYTDSFHEIMDLLGLLTPDVEPCATDHISEMIQLIEQLIQKGVAYQTGADVWFDIGKWKNYGSLSGRTLDELKVGARVEVDSSKKNPLDFALWKGAKEGEPWWESPWGKGRPGWHLECSAMSMKYLGTPIDIHGGGQDLIFPHHENEKAQSEAATEKEFVRHWVHNGFVTVNHEKMSKSLGNFFILKELFKQFDPMVVRYYYLSHHYRSPMEFSLEVLQENQEPCRKIQNCLSLTKLFIQEKKYRLPDENEILSSESIAQFKNFMDDDFNTSRVLALVHELVGALNRAREERELNPESLLQYGALKKILLVLGLNFKEEKVDVIRQAGTTEKSLSEKEIESLIKKSNCTPEELHQLAQARQELRQQKKFALADAIRNQMDALGYLIEDTPEGARVRKK